MSCELVVAAYIERIATDRQRLIHAIDIARTPLIVRFCPSLEKNILRLFFLELNMLMTEVSLTRLQECSAQTARPKNMKINQITTAIQPTASTSLLLMLSNGKVTSRWLVTSPFSGRPKTLMSFNNACVSI